MVGKKRSPLAKGSRAVETREPKVIEKICVFFSFKHLVDMDDVGQSLTTWAGKDWAVSNSKCNTRFNERQMALPGYG